MSGSATIWAVISCHYLGPILKLGDCVTTKDQRAILEDPVHTIAQTVYPKGVIVQQDNNASMHMPRLVKYELDELEI